MTEGYAILPNWMIRDSDISGPALLIWAALAGRVNREAECWPSLGLIAKEARCSKTTVKKYLAELETLGLVTHERRRAEGHGNLTNIYRLHLGVGRQAADPRSSGGRRSKPIEVNTLKEDESKTGLGVSREHLASLFPGFGQLKN